MSLRYWKYCRDQKIKGFYEAKCVPFDNGVRIDAGPFSHEFRLVEGCWRQPAMNDFAAYSLAALSMSNGVGFRLNAPVSMDVSGQIARLTDIYRFWAIRKLAPLRLELPEIVQSVTPQAREDSGIICLSGGIDSTYAAIKESHIGTISHGLLIAGADYPNAGAQGFRELRGRVGKIADRLGLQVSIIETDIRKHRLNWDMMHGFVLASCLHAMSARHNKARIALDYAGYQELFAHPWGNNSALPQYFSTPSFPISGVGREKRRVDKLADIAAFDSELLNSLSICFSSTETGGNCGRCPKCISTRLLFHALNLNQEAVFQSTSSLESVVDRMSVPKSFMAIRSRYLRVAETLDALPSGRLRDKLSNYEGDLRRSYLKKRT
jgi:hypothetical protein